MGVLTLDSYIRKTFPKNVKYYKRNSKVPLKFKCLGLDANPFVYQAVYRAFECGPEKTLIPENSKLSYEEKIELVYEYTWQEIVSVVNIVTTEEIYIAFDSVAPLAKINQQRQRRYGREPSKEGEFDLSNISTGTKFMRDLCIYIKLKIHEAEWPKVIFSGHTVPGEGEHKIMDYFRSLPKSKVCLYGPDGDLIMLGLASPHDFYLLKSEWKQTDSLYTIEMKTLKKDICNHLKTDIETFVFLGALLGNDFMPRLEIFYLFYSGVTDLYKYVHGSLFEKDGLNLTGFKFLLMGLASDEATLLAKRTEHPFPLLNKYLDQKGVLNYEAFKAEYYREWLHDYPIDKLCREYLDTLWWNWLYYTQGCSTFNHCYPHHYPPFISDLLQAVETWTPPTFQFTEAKTPFHQLVCILPKNRCHLLPPAYWPIFDSFPDPSTIERNTQGRHPEYDAVFETPIPKDIEIDVEHEHFHSRNAVTEDRVFTLGEQEWVYKTKYGRVISRVEG